MTRIRASIAILLAATVMVGGLMAVQWREMGAARAEVEQSLAVIERGRALLTEFVNAETSQRGYIVTRDEKFLEPYEDAAKRAPVILEALVDMTADNPSQRARLGRVGELWSQRAAYLAQGIAEARASRFDAARDIVANGQGRALMEGLRAEIDGVVAEDQRLLAERLAAASWAESMTRWLMIATLSLAAAGLIAALYSALKDNSKLAALVDTQRRTAESLETAHAELARMASQTQVKLDDTSRLLQAAVASAPIFVWSQDKNLVYRWFSGRPLGRSPDRFIGKSDYELMPESIKDKVVSNNLAVLESGQPRVYELMLHGKGGDRWYDVRLEPTRDESGAVNGLTGVAIEITDRKRREQNIRLLMREIAHRSKNILAVVQAMARQTAASTANPDEFVQRFAARLEALAATHALLVDDGWTGAEMSDLIRSQIGHHLDLLDRQIFLSGPPLRLPSDASQNIGLALHELGTNASKYGALSAPTGRVDVSWEASAPVDGKRMVTLKWIERNGPPVQPPKRKGFGQVVIERTVSRALNGSVDIRYDPEGFSWSLTFPLNEESAEGAA